MPGLTTPTSQLLDAFRQAYVSVKGSDRCVHPSDKLVDDLDLTSVDCLDILAIVDDILGLEAFDRVVEGDAILASVADVLAALSDAT